MSYTVEWLEPAEQELAAAWLRSSDRMAVTNAANELDRLLRIAPESQGESRPGGRRIAFCKPLAIIYRVYPDQSLVLVSFAWVY